ncbi:hypothetical protein ASF06_07785 [Agreia sp. Leaf244]|uniref:hypothetical protein n=1 Tax=Agreia sp. Leaf244 TaxID=1736305 RepID=UPI0006FB0D70|nr:hypothetical protein [Agreia sp. Leaf244]KQO10103.1 hypothetical protein ASF06_07785 [Agreia sp. Leaf244]
MTHPEDAPLRFSASYETPLDPLEALDVVAAYAFDRRAHVFNRTDRVIQVQLGSGGYTTALPSSLPMNLDVVVTLEDGHPTLVELIMASDDGPLRRSAALSAAYADLAEDTVARLQRRSRGTTVS